MRQLLSEGAANAFHGRSALRRTHVEALTAESEIRPAIEPRERVDVAYPQKVLLFRVPRTDEKYRWRPVPPKNRRNYFRIVAKAVVEGEDHTLLLEAFPWRVALDPQYFESTRQKPDVV